MFSGPAEARLLIRERMDTYADAAFRADVDAWLANWTDDAVWAVAGQDFAGKAALRAQWDRTWAHMERMAFFTQLAALDVTGARARARCYCREIVLLKGGAIRKLVGQYDDELVRQGGVWLFARRGYTLFMDESAGAPLPSAHSGAV